MDERSSTEETMRSSNQPKVDAIELKTIDMRLSGIKDATQRSRFIFLVMTIVAATILAGLWNSVFAWDKLMAFQKRSDDALVRENQRIVTTEWLKKLNISVGLFGTQIGSADLAVIGSSTLIIIMLWFFFAQRRENRAIVGLLRYCFDGVKNNELSEDVCKLVYEGVVNSIVFIDMGGGDKPVKGLEPDKSIPQRNAFIRFTLSALVFLAPITILAIVLTDISSLFTPSFVRDTPEPLWRIIFDGGHRKEVAEILIFELLGILAFIYTLFLCIKCRKFSEATSETIKQFHESVVKPTFTRINHSKKVSFYAHVFDALGGTPYH